MTQNEQPSTPPDSDDGFSEDERITQNLRFRSLPAAQRTLIGLFVFIPPKWRGPVAIIALLLLVPTLAYLALKLPALISWIKGTP